MSKQDIDKTKNKFTNNTLIFWVVLLVSWLLGVLFVIGGINVGIQAWELTLGDSVDSATWDACVFGIIKAFIYIAVGLAIGILPPALVKVWAD